MAWCECWTCPPTAHRRTLITCHSQQRGLSPIRRESMWILGTATAECIFWCKGVQPMCTVMPRHPDGCLLQKTWKREVLSVQTVCSCGWARLLHPLVFSTSRGMGRAATVTYKRLASLLAMKRELPYSVIMGWLRCQLSFSLLRSAVICLRGCRSAYNNVPSYSMNIAVHEGRIPLVAELLTM